MDLELLREKAAEAVWRNVGQEAIEQYELIKESYSPTLRSAGEALGFFPGNVAGIPVSPSPLRALLTTGLLGAGLGYGAGVLGEKMLPESWQRGRLRKTLGIMGALAGGAIGSVPILSNKMQGLDWNDNSQWQIPRIENDPPSLGFKHITPSPVLRNPNQDMRTLDLKPSPAFKAAADRYNSAGSVAPKIDVNEFNQVVWADPRVTTRLPVGTRAAATGLLEAAAYGTPSDNKTIGPLDVARITAGMGSGYLSGALVGRGLGLLMGMPPETQDLLKTTGMWAGAVRSFVNTAFGL